jgi:hypothetical protein
MFLRIAFLSAVLVSLGCSAVPPPVSPEARVSKAAGAPATKPVEGENVELSLAALDAYDHRRITLLSNGGKKSVVLVRDGSVLPEAEFRKDYRTVVGSNDLDLDAWQRARRNNAKAVALASGMTVVGIGGLVLIATTKEPPGCPGCAKGVVGSLTFAGAGLYFLGCEMVKGVRCILDGSFGGTGLTRESAARFVDEYNQALARSLAQPRALPVRPTSVNEHG